MALNRIYDRPMRGDRRQRFPRHNVFGRAASHANPGAANYGGVIPGRGAMMRGASGGDVQDWMGEAPDNFRDMARGATGIKDFRIDPQTGEVQWSRFNPDQITGELIRSGDRRYQEEGRQYTDRMRYGNERHLGELQHRARMGDIEAQQEIARIRADAQRHGADVGLEGEKYRADAQERMDALQHEARMGNIDAQRELGRLREENVRFGHESGLEGTKYGHDKALEQAGLRHTASMEQIAAQREASRGQLELGREKLGQGMKNIGQLNELFGISDLLGGGGGGDMGSFTPGGSAQNNMGTGGPGLGEQEMMNRYAGALQGGSLANIGQGAQQRGNQMMGPQGGMGGVPQSASNMDQYTAAMAGVANKDKAFQRQLQRGQLGAQLMGNLAGFARG